MRIGASVDREQLSPTVAYFAVQQNFARSAFSAAFSPEVCLSESGNRYTQGLFGYTYYSEVHSGNVLTPVNVQNIYNLRCWSSRCFLCVCIGASVRRGSFSPTVVYFAAQRNFAWSAFSAATTTPQYMTSVQSNLLWTSCLWLFGSLYELWT